MDPGIQFHKAVRYGDQVFELQKQAEVQHAVTLTVFPCFHAFNLMVDEFFQMEKQVAFLLQNIIDDVISAISLILWQHSGGNHSLLPAFCRAVLLLVIQWFADIFYVFPASVEDEFDGLQDILFKVVHQQVRPATSALFPSIRRMALKSLFLNFVPFSNWRITLFRPFQQ